MRFFKENPRKTLILVSYLLVFIIAVFFVHVSMPVLLLVYLVLTLLFIGIFFVDCVAMLGNIQYGRGQTEKAIPLFKFSIMHHSKSPAAHLNYAIYLLRRGDAKEASPLLDRAMALNTNIIVKKNIQLTMASCRWVMGDVDSAIAVLEGMRKSYEYVNAHVLSSLSYMYFLKGDIDQAKSLSEAAIADTPGASSAWDNLGQIYYSQNDFVKAKESFAKALEYKEDLVDSLYYLGLIARAEGEETQAMEYFNRALGSTISALNTVTRKQIEEALAGKKE